VKYWIVKSISYRKFLVVNGTLEEAGYVLNLDEVLSCTRSK